MHYAVVGLVLLAISPIASARHKAQQRPPISAPIPLATLESIIERVRPSIVGIVVNYEYRIQERTDMFSASESGTGFIVDSAGHIATAGHVVSLVILSQMLKETLTRANLHLIDNTVRRTSIEIRLP